MCAMSFLLDIILVSRRALTLRTAVNCFMLNLSTVVGILIYYRVNRVGILSGYNRKAVVPEIRFRKSRLEY